MKQINLIKQLAIKYPKIQFQAGSTYVWSPKEKAVFFITNPSDTSHASWSLLHETGHALLDHTNYTSDIQLVLMEADAWNKAQDIARELKISIEEDHIQDCLDSYRDWLHKRSLCPNCKLSGIQLNNRTYTCIFCNAKWTVSPARFCRTYRRKAT